MSKSLAEYGEQKSCAVTTARRPTYFLGDTMVKDKGLRCKYIIACEPRAELFDKFLHRSTLEECYFIVLSVANCWLDLLDVQSSTMSKSLAKYGKQKSCAVTTARRPTHFLGDTMVKDKGLRCKYIIACEPRGHPVSERAVPVAIFETDP
nr:DNA polymerase epsilon catalytic subunit A-like [Tanacetum cinerariifolium]